MESGACSGAGEGASADAGAGTGTATACYVLFDGYTDALALYQAARAAGISARVSPTPRQARSECGSSLLIECAERVCLEELADRRGLAFQRIVELERQIDPARDRFC